MPTTSKAIVGGSRVVSVNATQKLRLGETDVIRIGLGTNRLTHTPEHIAFVREAVAAGVNVIDTAHVYTGGESEEAIGTALSPIPDGCMVATKGGLNGGRAEVLQAEIEESLRRLQTDSIPLYYLHRVDPATPLEQSVGAIKEQQDSGKIRHVGLSNVGVEEIERARQLVPVAAVQNHYSLVERKHDDVVDYCTRESIVFVPYFPLGGTDGSALAEIAERRGATPVQTALAWLLARSPTTAPIPGTLSLDHLNENLAAVEIELSKAEFEALL
jgi:pyridoxine 4-dehydrogenase